MVPRSDSGNREKIENTSEINAKYYSARLIAYTNNMHRKIATIGLVKSLFVNPKQCNYM